MQAEIFNEFHSINDLEERNRILNQGLNVSRIISDTEGEPRQIRVTYSVNVNGRYLKVCKTMYTALYGSTRAKMDALIKKRKSLLL